MEARLSDFLHALIDTQLARPPTAHALPGCVDPQSTETRISGFQRTRQPRPRPATPNPLANKAASRLRGGSFFSDLTFSVTLFLVALAEITGKKRAAALGLTTMARWTTAGRPSGAQRVRPVRSSSNDRQNSRPTTTPSPAPCLLPSSAPCLLPSSSAPRLHLLSRLRAYDLNDRLLAYIFINGSAPPSSSTAPRLQTPFIGSAPRPSAPCLQPLNIGSALPTSQLFTGSAPTP